MHLEDILRECAEIQGFKSRRDSIVLEFYYFILSSIEGYSGGKEAKAIYEKYHNKIDFVDDSDALLKWGKLFLEYCKEEYGSVEP